MQARSGSIRRVIRKSSHAAAEVLESRLVLASAAFPLGTLVGDNGFAIEGYGGFGATVAGGDINGDGFDDFLQKVGNEIRVVFGTPEPMEAVFEPLFDGTDGFKVFPGNLGAYSFSGAGDTNGDGFDDLIVSQQIPNTPGIAYLIFGKAGGFAPAIDLTNLNPSDGVPIANAGFQVASLGDVSGDGFADIGFRRDSFEVSVIFGQSSFPSDLDLSDLDGTNGFRLFTGNESQNSLSSVAAAGDFNGDGIGDIAVTELGDYIGYIIFGRSTPFPAQIDFAALDGASGFKLASNRTNAFGVQLNGIGDFNGDGFSDVAFSVATSIERPPAYIIFGRGSPVPPMLDVDSLAEGDGFKVVDSEASQVRSIVRGGDVNGDGFADFLVHSEKFFVALSLTRSSVVLGGPDPVGKSIDLAELKPSEGFLFFNGRDFFPNPTGVGDFNGDGLDDLLVSPSLREALNFLIFGFDERITPNGKNSQLTIRDLDGDVVKIKVSGGNIVPQDILLSDDGQILKLNLANAPERFAGASIKIIANKREGDGFVNVGAVDSVGINLKTLLIDGDLGQVDVGTGEVGAKGLKTLKVRSLGTLGGNTQIPGTIDPLLSEIAGALGSLRIGKDLKDAIVDVSGTLGRVTIGGDMSGDPTIGAEFLRSLDFERALPRLGGGQPGSVSSGGDIKTFKVKGILKGGAIESGGDLGELTVGGDIDSALVAADGRIPVIKAFGSIRSSDPETPAVVAALARVGGTRPADTVAIDSLSIRGDVENARILLGYNRQQAALNPDASAGKVVVKGDWAASSLAAGVSDASGDGFGRNDALIDGDSTAQIAARIASVIIKGTATGSPEEGDHFGITAQSIGKLSIDGTKITLVKNSKDDVLLDETNGDFRVTEI
jgi:hypothetical protein